MNNTIPAAEHTIAVLEYLSSTASGATQSEICKKLQISMSSTYRILQTLLKHRWARKDEPDVMNWIMVSCRWCTTVTAVCRYLNMPKVLWMR